MKTKSKKKVSKKPNSSKKEMINIPKLGTGGAMSGGLSMAGTGASIGSAFGPVGTVVGGAVGLIGGAIMGGAAEEREKKAAEMQRTLQIAAANPVNAKTGYTNTFETGGNMNIGQTPIQINPQNNNPADNIPTDAQGNPSVVSGNAPIAMTDDGEVIWNGYVFSNKLGFAKKAKKIIDSFKLKLGEDLDRKDAPAKEALDLHLMKLANEQDEYKIKNNIKDELPNKLVGGKLLDTFNPLPDVEKVPLYTPTEANKMFGTAKNKYEGLNLPELPTKLGSPNLNIRQSSTLKSGDNELKTLEGSIKKDMLPGIIGQGLSLAGQTVKLLTDTPEYQAPITVNPHTIDLTKDKLNLAVDKERAMTQANRAARGDMAAMIETTNQIGSNYNKALSDLQTKEATTNAQILTDAEKMNAESMAKTRELNAQEKAGYDSAVMQTIRDLGGMSSGISRDFAAAKNAAMMILNSGDRYIFDEKTGRIKINPDYKPLNAKN